MAERPNAPLDGKGYIDIASGYGSLCRIPCFLLIKDLDEFVKRF